MFLDVCVSGAAGAASVCGGVPLPLPSPTFIREKAAKEKREFYIPCISRETSLYGTEFEVRLYKYDPGTSAQEANGPHF